MSTATMPQPIEAPAMPKETKITFTLCNLSDYFYECLESKSNLDKYRHLIANKVDLPTSIKMSDNHTTSFSMRTAMEFNALYKQYTANQWQPEFKIEPRKGYKLVTFYF